MVRFPMRQRDVPDAAVGEIFHVLDLVVDWRAVLHPHRKRDQSFGKLRPDIGDALCDRKFLRMLLDDCFDESDERVGELICAVVFPLGGYVDRHERRVQAPFFRPDIIEVPFCSPLGNVLPFIVQPVGNIDMTVDNDGFLCQFLGLCEIRIGGLSKKYRNGNEDKKYGE